MLTEEQKLEFVRLRRVWDEKEIRARYTKDMLIRMLLTTYTVSCPWEMDDCLYYAQKVYPDTTIEDIQRIYNE